MAVLPTPRAAPCRGVCGGVCNDVPQVKSAPLSDFVNKFYWHTATLTRLGIVCGCFPAATAELSSCHRDHLGCKAENVHCLVLSREACLALWISIQLPTFESLALWLPQSVLGSLPCKMKVTVSRDGGESGATHIQALDTGQVRSDLSLPSSRGREPQAGRQCSSTLVSWAYTPLP